jgi:hypothetical protein
MSRDNLGYNQSYGPEPLSTHDMFSLSGKVSYWSPIRENCAIYVAYFCKLIFIQSQSVTNTETLDLQVHCWSSSMNNSN